MNWYEKRYRIYFAVLKDGELFYLGYHLDQKAAEATANDRHLDWSLVCYSHTMNAEQEKRIHEAMSSIVHIDPDMVDVLIWSVLELLTQEQANQLEDVLTNHFEELTS